MFVRGARKVDTEADADEEFWRDVQQNQTSGLVSWRWDVVRPTTLRTSLAYSKVSSSSWNQDIVISILHLDLHGSLCAYPKHYPLHHPHDSQLPYLQNY